jgi:hypothetical protein
MGHMRRTVHPNRLHVQNAATHDERAHFETHDTAVQAPKECVVASQSPFLVRILRLRSTLIASTATPPWGTSTWNLRNRTPQSSSACTLAWRSTQAQLGLALRGDELSRGSITRLPPCAVRLHTTARLRDCAAIHSSSGSISCPTPLPSERKSEGAGDELLPPRRHRGRIQIFASLSHSPCHRGSMGRTVRPTHLHVQKAVAHSKRARSKTRGTAVQAPKEHVVASQSPF